MANGVRSMMRFTSGRLKQVFNRYFVNCWNKALIASWAGESCLGLEVGFVTVGSGAFGGVLGLIVLGGEALMGSAALAEAVCGVIRAGAWTGFNWVQNSSNSSGDFFNSLVKISAACDLWPLLRSLMASASQSFGVTVTETVAADAGSLAMSSRRGIRSNWLDRLSSSQIMSVAWARV